MPINNPTALVEEFKKSGEFDRLRRELLAQFQQDPSFPTFRENVEDIARKRIANDQERLQFLPTDVVLKELTQEVQRYPIVERAASNVRSLSDPSFLDGVQKAMQKILRYDKGLNSPILKVNDDGQERETTRTEVTQGTADRPEKTVQEAQEVHESDKISKQPSPVGESNEQSSTSTTGIPGEAGEKKSPQEEDKPQDTGPGPVITSPSEANETNHESLSHAEDLMMDEKQVQDRPPSQTDVEMPDVKKVD